METSNLPEDRDGFRFRGGARCLDLTATLQGRLSPESRELLETPRDLERWLKAAGLADGAPATNGDLATAHRLREAIYALANALVSGEAAPAARDTLNGVAAGESAAPRLGADGALRLVGSAGAVLVSLARETVRLLGGEEARRVRQCAGPTCSIFFLDTSRKGERRWCSMSACGNRAKVERFRRRTPAATSPSSAR
jgi:predicted RNA-binding Zn ribbon-like protein